MSGGGGGPAERSPAVALTAAGIPPLWSASAAIRTLLLLRRSPLFLRSRRTAIAPWMACILSVGLPGAGEATLSKDSSDVLSRRTGCKMR